MGIDIDGVQRSRNGNSGQRMSLQRTFHRCFLPCFGSFGQVISEEKIFKKSANQKQELTMTAMFVNGSKRNEQFPKMLPTTFGPFGKAVTEDNFFLNRPFRNKNCLWQPYLLMDQGEMSNLYRGPPIDASQQVSVHLAKPFQRRNQPIRNKNCLWWPCLLTDREEMSNHNRILSIDASYQVSYHLAKRFQRKSCFRKRPIRNKN